MAENGLHWFQNQRKKFSTGIVDLNKLLPLPSLKMGGVCFIFTKY